MKPIFITYANCNSCGVDSYELSINQRHTKISFLDLENCCIHHAFETHYYEAVISKYTDKLPFDLS